MARVVVNRLRILKILEKHSIGGRRRRYNHRSNLPTSTAVGQRYISNDVKWSYSSSPGDVPFLGKTLGNLLEMRAEQHPDRDAIVFCEPDIRRTYEQFQLESNKMAAGLISLGLNRGDRIGVCSPTNLEWLLTFYAAVKIGLIVVPINPAYKEAELEHSLNKVTCKAIIAIDKFRDTSLYDMLLKLIPELDANKCGYVSSKKFPFLKHIIILGDERKAGTNRFKDVFSAGGSDDMTKVDEMQKRIQMDDPASILFTSGTTGQPKGATLSHHQMINCVYFVGRRAEMHKQETRACVPSPLYHAAGLNLAGTNIAVNGITAVVPSTMYNPTAILKALQKERCNQIWVAPTMCVDLVNHPDLDKYDISTLKQVFVGGSPCSPELMSKFKEKLHITDISSIFGLTECVMVSFQCKPTDPPEKQLTTIGRVGANLEAKIVDSEDNIVPVGTRGQLCTRGYNTMLGYWGDPEKTAEVYTPDRWFHTGDMAIMDEDGFCQIVGRFKEMIIRGGVNIYPAEIENLLHKHPKIRDAQVLGVPDERRGEELYAAVILREGEQTTDDEIRDFCRENIAAFKVPKYVKVVSDYPLTVSGKVQKYVLKERAIKELGLKYK